jgi:ABC-type bacteriocin/lantibiotic exporter with double-glycine peptidase domain
MSAADRSENRLAWFARLFAGRHESLIALIGLLAELAREQRWRVVPALVAAAVLSCLALVPATLLAWLIDYAFASRAAGAVAGIAAALAIVALVDALTGYARRMFAARATLDMRRDLAEAAFAAAIRLPIDRREARDHGLLGRSFEEIERIAQAASEGLLEIALGLGTVVVLAVAMLVVDARLGLAVLALVVLLAGVHLWAARRLRRREATWLAARSAYWSHLVESIAYGLTIRISPAHRFAEQRFSDRLRADLDAGLAVTRIAAALDAAGRLVGGLMTAAIAFLGGSQVIAGGMSLGEFVLFLAIAGSLTAPVLGFAKAVDDLQATLVAAGRLAELAAAPHERMASYEDAPPPGRGVVAMARVRFAYDRERPVLSQATLTLIHGERVALTGASGLGKTTLASLIVALRTAHRGSITLDGTPIEQVPLGELRRRVVLVPHEIEIFTGTVAENIALGEPEADRVHIEEAARIACLDADIAALRSGYDTFLGQGAAELSAGQKQRLGIARALMRRPELLILDESTSALDLETEGKVLDNLLASLPGTTILAITHRASVAKRMTRAIDLSEVDQPDAMTARGAT